jgi:hypothetical protein
VEEEEEAFQSKREGKFYTKQCGKGRERSQET